MKTQSKEEQNQNIEILVRLMVFTKLFVLLPEVAAVKPKITGKRKRPKKAKVSKMNKHTVLSEEFVVEIDKNSLILEPITPESPPAPL